jgi:methionyl-tRNA formyltransferase
MTPVRTVFLGTPDFAAVILQRLLDAEGVDVAAVFTQPDRSGGRGRKRLEPPVKKLAVERGIPVYQPEKLDQQSLEELRGIAPDVLAVAAYGLILPDGFLGAAPLGAVNVHASLLPRYRGAAPIQWALLNGEQVTGITTMLMERGMDTGPILQQRALAIGVDDTAGSLHDELAEMGGALLPATLTALAEGSLIPIEQDSERASYAPKLDKSARRIDWNRPAWEVHNRIRALYPVPGAYCTLRTSSGREIRVGLHPGAPGEELGSAQAGEVLGLDASERLGIACADRVYSLTTVQPASGKTLSARDFYNGYLV